MPAYLDPLPTTIIILFILEKNININDLVLELEHRAPFAAQIS